MLLRVRNSLTTRHFSWNSFFISIRFMFSRTYSDDFLNLVPFNYIAYVILPLCLVQQQTWIDLEVRHITRSIDTHRIVIVGVMFVKHTQFDSQLLLLMVLSESRDSRPFTCKANTNTELTLPILVIISIRLTLQRQLILGTIMADCFSSLIYHLL